jgi:hypothetical protein
MIAEHCGKQRIPSQHRMDKQINGMKESFIKMNINVPEAT